MDGLIEDCRAWLPDDLSPGFAPAMIDAGVADGKDMTAWRR